jgi:hypothetical protein
MIKKRHKAKYPAATIAFYGPDDVLATKVVVAIIQSETSEPDPMRKWSSEGTDVRQDKGIGEEIEAFLKEHNVKDVVLTDGIIGCPHEEGIDYPEGTNCPLCPFWKDLDWSLDGTEE